MKVTIYPMVAIVDDPLSCFEVLYHLHCLGLTGFILFCIVGFYSFYNKKMLKKPPHSSLSNTAHVWKSFDPYILYFLKKCSCFTQENFGQTLQHAYTQYNFEESAFLFLLKLQYTLF